MSHLIFQKSLTVRVILVSCINSLLLTFLPIMYLNGYSPLYPISAASVLQGSVLELRYNHVALFASSAAKKLRFFSELDLRSLIRPREFSESSAMSSLRHCPTARALNISIPSFIHSQCIQNMEFWHLNSSYSLVTQLNLD